MTFAFISISPREVLDIFDNAPSSLSLPNGDRVEGAQVGWTGENYALVAVTPFVPPAGQVTSGSPSYAFDGNGNVVETYAMVAAPAPGPIIITPLEFRRLFTLGERTAITTAGMTNVGLRMFLDDEAAAPEVNLSDPEITQGLAACVAAGLLTQDRANLILVGTLPG